MKLHSRQSSVSGRPGASGTARVDRRLGAVLRKLKHGDVAVIDHLDLDRASAEALLDHGVSAVVNASPFISGRYPNLGPELLARAGVVLVDDVGAEVFSKLRDGATVRIDQGVVHAGDTEVARGRELGVDDVVALMDQARSGLATQLQSFTHNTTEFLRREQDLLLHGQGVPTLRTKIQGRPVVVVVRDFDHEADLRRLRRFIADQGPVLIGVDSGADALLSRRLTPDLVVIGEDGLQRGSAGVQARTISDKALTKAREVVVHADASDRLIGADRLERLGVRAQRIAASGTSEDIALLIADAKGASLIVTVGTHATLDEFLDRQRAGLASTFLTRLRVGPRLVDAKAVPTLYAGRLRAWHLALLLLAVVLVLVAAVASTPVGEDWWTGVEDLFVQAREWLEGLLP